VTGSVGSLAEAVDDCGGGGRCCSHGTHGVYAGTGIILLY